MQHSHLLRDLLLVLALAVGVVFVFARWRQPTIVGLLVTGVIAGPWGLRLVSDPAAVEELAEVGVVLLLFSIGLEMSLADLFRMGKVVLVGGALQVGLTAAASGVAAWLMGAGPAAAVALGCVVALSSTAVVTKLLADQGQLEAPQGRNAFAVLIFQDLCVLPMTAVFPLLAKGAVDAVELVRTLGSAVALVGLFVIVVRQIVPRVLELIVSTRSSELFILGTLLVSLGTAWVGSTLGLSTALGAFLAGLVVAGSPYSHHAMAQVLPFRNAFNSLFFISVGMLVNVPLVYAHAGQFFSLLALALILKFVCAASALAIVGVGARTSVATALCLAQIGEFSLVLVKMAHDAHILDRASVDRAMAVAVLSLLATPALVGAATAAGAWAARVFGERAITTPPASEHEVGHVIIVGFGVNGRNLARVLKLVGVPYEVLELNGATVARLREEGEPIHFGDVSSVAMMEHLGIRRARELVLAISDPAGTRLAVKLARELAPMIKIVVRTRYAREIEDLYASGADLVITDEMESSLRLVSVVLAHCDVPVAVRTQLVDEILADHYGPLVPPEMESAPAEAPRIPGVESRTVVLPAGAPTAGRSIAELSVRARTGATCLSIARGSDTFANPGPDFVLAPGDRVVVFGDPTSVARAEQLLVQGEAALEGEGPRRRASDRRDR
jgi:CPA2 family monovalent cation:H+ antiporter-2